MTDATSSERMDREKRKALRELGWNATRGKAKRPWSVPRYMLVEVAAEEEEFVDVEAKA